MTCGGCQFIFMSTSKEQQEKRNIFQDVFSRAGIFLEHAPEFHAFPFDESRFRGTIHFKNGKAGFFSQKSHQISSISGCRVIPKVMSEVYKTLNTFASCYPQLEGDVFFAVAPKQDQVVLTVKIHELIKPTALKGLSESLNEVQAIKGVALVCGNKRSTLFGDPSLSLKWNTHCVRLASSSFFQSNPSSWYKFWGYVANWSRQEFSPSQIIWDIHAGSGFLVSAVKNNPIFATEPDSNAQGNLLSLVKGRGESMNCRAEDAIRRLSGMDLGGLIMDPPRGGLSKKLRQWITRSGPESILFFSCELSTLARDLKELLRTYRISGPIQLLDVSPGTFRMETVITLKRISPRQNKMSS